MLYESGDENETNVELDSLIGEAKPSEEQQSFNALPMDVKFERLNQLVQQSKVYSQIILENMMEKALSKKEHQKSTEKIENENEITEIKSTLKKNTEAQPKADKVVKGSDTNMGTVRHSSRLSKKLESREPITQTRRKKRNSKSNKVKPTETIPTGKVSERTLQTKKAIEAAQTGHNQQQPTIVSGCIMKDYQLDGLEWLVSLYENGLNGILADEMGLGKTLQCIALYGYLIENGIKGPFLVVAPLSTISNWCREFQKFAPGISVLQYVGGKEKRGGMSLKMSSLPNVVVTSYEIMIRDHSKFAKVNWEYLTVDEGHRLKNFQSILIRYLKKLRVGNRLLLTGTPLQNNLKELWSLLNFILPEIFHDLDLFESWFDFDEITHVKGDGIAEDERKLVKEKIQTDFVKHLHSILQPFLLRRLKENVIRDLPPKKEYIIFAELTPIQQLFYNGAIDGALYRTVVQFYLKEYLIQNHRDIIYDEEGLEFVDEILRKRFGPEIIEKRKRVAFYSEESSDFSEDEVYERKLRRIGDSKKLNQNSEMGKKLRGRNTEVTSNIDSDLESRIGKAKLRRGRDLQISRDRENNGSNLSLNAEEISAKKLKFEELRYEVVNRVLHTIEGHVKNLLLQNGVMQLRNICATHYTYYEPFPIDADDGSKFDSELAKMILENSGKMKMLEQLTDRLLNEKHKILIFSQFTRVLDLIALYFKERDISFSRLDGRMDQDLRTEEIELFSSYGKNSTDVFLLSTRAGGLGLNLIHADTVILFDNDWNPQMDLQAIDRVHRIGQTKPVKIFRFVVRNTVEELLIMKSFNKRALEKLVIELGNFQLGRIAKKLVAENIDISAVDSFNSVLALGKRLHVHDSGANEIDQSKSNAVLMHKFEHETKELTEEEMDELMDRSFECFQREPREFAHMSSFETKNNMEK